MDALEIAHELPFGEKIQNHALNNRCNGEFKKYYKKKTKEEPIIIDQEKSRYYINERLLFVKLNNGDRYDIAKVCIKIIDKYIKLKIKQFKHFFEECMYYKKNWKSNVDKSVEFIESKLDKKVDVRIFEVISYVICKNYYEMSKIWIGKDKNNLTQEQVKLYKMGRTNSNDGGIDFLMLPLGKVFQVTESLNFKKYFLDIDKLNKFPITFIVKTKKDAVKIYPDKDIVNKYINCFEKIITSSTLMKFLGNV